VTVDHRTIQVFNMANLTIQGEIPSDTVVEIENALSDYAVATITEGDTRYYVSVESGVLHTNRLGDRHIVRAIGASSGIQIDRLSE
jgi:hypothetical protein